VSEIPTSRDRLRVHKIVFKEARAMARVAAEAGDDGTNDVIVNDVGRRNELQVWFVAGHLVDTPLVQAVSRGCVAAG
jgi:starvation-inducible DNA-binding protein